MAMGRMPGARQEGMFIAASAVRALDNPFHAALDGLLREHGFDEFAEETCREFHAERMGRPGLAPGVYFRMLMVGYLEGIGSERGIAWRCRDSISLREFLGCGLAKAPPEHSTLSKTSRRLSLEAHGARVRLGAGAAAGVGPASGEDRWRGLDGLGILVRADSAYAREEIMAWCEDNDADYVIGVARNDRLVRKIEPELLAARVESRGCGRPVRIFSEFDHSTRRSWSRPRRVIAKAEHLPGKPNPRFVVTSLPETISARTVYERVYCPRGNAENAIKEQQLGLFADRTSASPLPANQLRLLFSAFASILMAALRRALTGTGLARATAGTLRAGLLKIGARVMVSARRVRIAMDSAHPSASAFARVHARLSG